MKTISSRMGQVTPKNIIQMNEIEITHTKWIHLKLKGHYLLSLGLALKLIIIDRKKRCFDLTMKKILENCIFNSFNGGLCLPLFNSNMRFEEHSLNKCFCIHFSLKYYILLLTHFNCDEMRPIICNLLLIWLFLPILWKNVKLTKKLQNQS